MVQKTQEENLLFQSELHPLVRLEFETEERYCLSLIHKKAYHNVATMAADRDVLDVGCNNGYGTKIIGENARSVIGVDVAEHSIEAAKNLHTADNIDYILVKGDMLPFPNQSFDLVTSFQVIEHVINVKSYLLEIKRVLRIGGLVVFTTPNGIIRLDAGMKPWNSFHVREYSANELEEILTSVFPRAEVQGLFATPEFYDIEFNRVHRKRLAARSRIGKLRKLIKRTRTQLIRAAKFVLPENMVKKIQTRVGVSEARRKSDESDLHAEARPKIEDFSKKWSLDDLFYRGENLDGALDLIAIAHSEPD